MVLIQYLAQSHQQVEAEAVRLVGQLAQQVVLEVVVKVKILALVAQEIPRQLLHLKVAMVALAVLLLAAVVAAVAVHLLLELPQRVHLAAQGVLVQHHLLLAHP